MHKHIRMHASGMGLEEVIVSGKQMFVHQHSWTWKFQQSMKLPFLLWVDVVYAHLLATFTDNHSTINYNK